jgi:hypothetical protein
MDIEHITKVNVERRKHTYLFTQHNSTINTNKNGKVIYLDNRPQYKTNEYSKNALVQP